MGLSQFETLIFFSLLAYFPREYDVCLCVCVWMWMWTERGSEKGLLSCKGNTVTWDDEICVSDLWDVWSEVLVFGGGKCSRTIVWIHHHNRWFCDQGEQVRGLPTYVPGSKSICCLFFWWFGQSPILPEWFPGKERIGDWSFFFSLLTS